MIKRKGCDALFLRRRPIGFDKYDNKVKEYSPDSPLFLNCLKAFLIGGAICLIGEAVYTLLLRAGADEAAAATGVSVFWILITAVLTGIGVFDVIARQAGAGTMVPITGFANSVCAPAIEYTTEGHVLGTAVRMFTIAGPVIVYGCSAASLYGFIYYFFIR